MVPLWISSTLWLYLRPKNSFSSVETSSIYDFGIAHKLTESCMVHDNIAKKKKVFALGT